MLKSKKYILVTLEITEGEHRYYNKTVHEAPLNKDIQVFAKKRAKSWYVDINAKPDGEAGDGGYYFEAGCLFVKVEQVVEVSKSEYEVLVKYL